VTDRLRGLTCLVTGATGIAAAGTRRFAREGANVFVVSRTPEHVQVLADELTAAGGSGGFGSAVADLTDSSAVDAAVAAAVDRFGRIDGLFAVAGGSGRRFGDGPIHEVSDEGWDRTLELNLRTQAMTCRAVVRQMLAQPPEGGRDGDPDANRHANGARGSILLMSSVLADHPVPALFGTHAYGAAKGAVVALATSMAATYAPDGIRVNVLAPGLTDTPMAQRAAADPATVEFARRKQPLANGLLDPDDIAAAAVYFLSTESHTVTGQCLAIDGGWSVTAAPV
jgi:NAD(P)-dependent dehydrogenase (short-subunit alcohol dehydrogenase family)